MYLIFQIIGVVAAIFFIVGLFKPENSLFWYNRGERTRAVSTLIYLPIWLIFIMISKELMPSVKEYVKVEAFNDMEVLKEKVNQIGIGSFHELSKDEVDKSYYCLMDYHEFGMQNSKTLLRNNLTFYINSPSEKYVKELKLALNINNPEDKQAALNEFRETIDKTLKIIKMQIPATIANGLKNEKSAQFQNDTLQIDLECKKDKIDHWRFIINSY